MIPRQLAARSIHSAGIKKAFGKEAGFLGQALDDFSAKPLVIAAPAERIPLTSRAMILSDMLSGESRMVLQILYIFYIHI